MRWPGRHQSSPDCANPFARRHLLAFLVRNLLTFVALLLIGYLGWPIVLDELSWLFETPALSKGPKMPEPDPKEFNPGKWQPFCVAGPIDEAETLFPIAAGENGMPRCAVLLWDSSTESVRYIHNLPVWLRADPELLVVKERDELVISQTQFEPYFAPFTPSDLTPSFRLPFDEPCRTGLTRMVRRRLSSGELISEQTLENPFSPNDIDLRTGTLLGIEPGWRKNVVVQLRFPQGKAIPLGLRASTVRYNGPDQIVAERTGGSRQWEADGLVPPLRFALHGNRLKYIGPAKDAFSARRAGAEEAELQGDLAILQRKCHMQDGTGKILSDEEYNSHATLVGDFGWDVWEMPDDMKNFRSATYWAIMRAGSSDEQTSSTLPIYFAGPHHILVHEPDRYRIERTEDYLRMNQPDPLPVYYDDGPKPGAPAWAERGGWI